MVLLATWPMNVYDGGGQVAKVLNKSMLKKEYVKEKWERIESARRERLRAYPVFPVWSQSIDLEQPYSELARFCLPLGQ